VTSGGSYESWGRYPRHRPIRVIRPKTAADVPMLSAVGTDVLAYGCGRSYGDCCLNEGGLLIDTRELNGLISLDRDRRVIRCEAGMRLDEVLDVVVPESLFLPVTPGTQFVTVGGAIANDVHGKNHHVRGTFGRHVRSLEILRSSGERMTCSPTENADLFHATIGGLGLTGIILTAEFDLIEIPGSGILTDVIKFKGIDEFFDLSAASARDFEYSVAWLDCSARGATDFRGLFIRGNHAPHKNHRSSRRNALNVPFDLPGGLINSWSIGLFNTLYFKLRPAERRDHLTHYKPFFYPLDTIRNWNRVYGSRGLLQYQCLLPPDHSEVGLEHIMSELTRSGVSSSLAVLKQFGDFEPAGLLSFPRAGTTLAMDFRNTADAHKLLHRFDEIVVAAGGAVYPAKDARMRSEAFEAYYPHWREILRFKDPNISSSMWRRLTAGSS